MSTEFPKPPMSAARLAAEAAFAAPAQPEPPPQAPAQVTLRRSRLAGGLDEAAGGGAVAPTGMPPEAAGPRVFRVVAAPSAAAPAVAPRALLDEAVATPATPRKRRVRAEQRPSPVVVVQVAPAPAPAAPLQPEALRAELQRAGALLEVAARAQAFHIDPHAFDRDWQRLSRRADELLKELQALNC